MSFICFVNPARESFKGHSWPESKNIDPEYFIVCILCKDGYIVLY